VIYEHDQKLPCEIVYIGRQCSIMAIIFLYVDRHGTTQHLRAILMNCDGLAIGYLWNDELNCIYFRLNANHVSLRGVGLKPKSKSPQWKLVFGGMVIS